MSLSLWIRIIIAAVLVGTAWLAVRLYARRQGGGPTKPVEIVARLGLSKGVSVAVVRVGGRGLVLGLSDKGVSVVAELGQDDLAGIVATRDPGTAGGPGHVPARVLAASPAALPEAPEDETVTVAETEIVAPALAGVDLRSITHRPVGPRMGPLQRLQRMTLRQSVPAGTGRPASPWLARRPIRHDVPR